MVALLKWLEARAQDIASLLLGALFLSFIAQIVFRYVINVPLSWTQELCLTLWLWVVFWGTAFLLDDADHVRFDVLYQSFGERGRRLLSLIYSAAIIAAFAVSLPATISYVTFYSIKSSPTLGLRLDFVFSVYLVFAIAVILQYIVRFWRTITGRPFEAKSFYATTIVLEDGAPVPNGHKTQGPAP
jgi:TRAP-type C4-dicarboxylate transport system permease small subunit